jgi:hypothetical protein
MAVGCSAETGEAEIGSTSQAIVKGDIDSSGPALSVAVAHHAGCEVTVSAEKYILLSGGQIPGAPGASDHVQVIRVSTGLAYDFSGILPAPIMYHQAVTEPGDASKCLVIGGEQSGTPTTSETTITELALQVNASKVPTGVNTASSGTLSVGRSRFQVLPCGTDSLFIAGGKNGSTAAAVDSIDVWNAGSVNPFKDASNNTTKMSTARREFSMAQADSTHIGIFGGVNSGGTQLASIDRAIVDSTCKLTTTLSSPFTLPTSPKSLNVARQGLVAFYNSHVAANQDDFVVAAGDNGGTAQTTHDLVKLDWSNSANDTRTNPLSVPVGTKAPTLAIIGTGHAFLLGGPGVNAMQEYVSGAWTSVTQDKLSATLANRDGAAAVVSSGVIYTVGGFDGTNYLTSDLLITP